VLSDASAAFDRGKSLERSDPKAALDAFGEAAQHYRALIESGVRNGRLYYNLGNAELQRGRLGEAILNYRRAQTLIPGDPRLESNLKFARSVCRSQIRARGRNELLGTIFYLHYETSMRTRLIACLGSYLAFWLVLFAGLWVRRFRARRWAALLAVVCLSLGASLVIQWQLEGRRPSGVIVADEAVVRKGNGLNYEPKFNEPLYAGVEFTLLEARGDWWHIALPDGKTGWVRADWAEQV
jgi:tetratricopeptide (TPR) repeat protein